eukprot:8460833-Pyramimonas_sp.AAC.1
MFKTCLKHVFTSGNYLATRFLSIDRLPQSQDAAHPACDSGGAQSPMLDVRSLVAGLAAAPWPP